ncbi:GntR family transcriptional regulator [Streptomyces sp. NPDC002643]
MSKVRWVEGVIRQRIQDGTYRPRTWLPTSRTLAGELGVSTSTAYVAFTRLHGEKLIGLEQRGFYVIDPKEPATCPQPKGIHPANKVARIEEAVRKRIQDGTYAALDWLPKLITLATEFSVAPSTACVALGPLKREGLVGSSSKYQRLYVIDRREPKALPAGAYRVQDIEALLQARLSDGTYPPGTLIPPHTALAEELGVALSAVTTVLQRLSSDALVVAREREATYAAERTPDSV